MDYKLYAHKIISSMHTLCTLYAHRAQSFIWFRCKNPCKHPRFSVTEISKLILFRGFQLVSHFKTTKTSEYNKIMVLD